MRLIDADALIDKTDDRYSLHEIGRRERDDIVDALEYAPTIQPEPHWIPVTERLPEYGEAVLTIAQDDVYEVNHIVDDVHGEWFWEDNGKVIAWMPLPEPYKGVNT